MESDLGKLFIGGISWDTDEERLKDYFSNYGEVVEAVIMRDRATGRARGFGFVVFADPCVAERVIMDKHMIDGRTVEAKKAVPKDDQHILGRNGGGVQGSPGPGRTRKIFVGGLASTVTEGDFKSYFDQFGTITDVVVMYDHNTQRPRGFGFITYDSEEAVERVLHNKTFHELNGKMVEVKRAVPKELSPSPARSPLIGGFNYGLGRANNFLSSYAQSYNLNPIGGGFGVRMDDRFNQISTGRTGFSPFGTAGYGMSVNLDPQVLSPTYSANSTGNNSLGYARILSPYYSSNGNRYNTPIGYNVGNGRSSSVLSSAARNPWGSGGGGVPNAANPSSPGAYLSSGSGNFGVSFGNGSPNWGPNSVISTQGGGGGSGSGFSDSSFGFGEGGGGYGRIGGTGLTAAPQSSSYERSYGAELYRGGSGSVYGGDSTWRSSTPDLDGSSSFGYGLGNITSDVAAKSSEDYIGSYSVARQPNRGIAA